MIDGCPIQESTKQRSRSPANPVHWAACFRHRGEKEKRTPQSAHASQITLGKLNAKNRSKHIPWSWALQMMKNIGKILPAIFWAANGSVRPWFPRHSMFISTKPTKQPGETRTENGGDVDLNTNRFSKLERGRGKPFRPFTKECPPRLGQRGRHTKTY